MNLSLQNSIETQLLKAVSATTDNVFYYLLPLNEDLTNDFNVTYQLESNGMENTLDGTAAINYSLEVVINCVDPNLILQNQVFITDKVLDLITVNGNVGSVYLTDDQQPVFDPDKESYSAVQRFNILYLNIN